MNLIRKSKSAVVAEFIRALLDRYTYSPHRNPETLFGFLWGLPIPIFTFGIYLNAAGLECSLKNCLAIVGQDTLYLFFALHPFFFAIIFGAHGTMRARRDFYIQTLLGDLEKKCDELFKANAKLTEVDKLKSEFLANVTHELKSPLVTALGYSDRILSEKLGTLTERQRHALDVSKRNLIRLRSLIEELLDFSRLEAGVARFRMTRFDLKDVFVAAMGDMSLRSREREIHIEPHLPEQETMVVADAGKLAQAIDNLLDNAIKFSPEGSCVHATLNADDKNCYIIITDQGPGIPPEFIPRLFERFSQADGSPSRPYNGVGLGLVIVKKIVEGHGGKVWLESQPGKGTSVHLELPIAAQHTSEQKEANHATSITH